MRLCQYHTSVMGWRVSRKICTELELNKLGYAQQWELSDPGRSMNYELICRQLAICYAAMRQRIRGSYCTDFI